MSFLDQWKYYPEYIPTISAVIGALLILLSIFSPECIRIVFLFVGIPILLVNGVELYARIREENLVSLSQLYTAILAHAGEFFTLPLLVTALVPVFFVYPGYLTYDILVMKIESLIGSNHYVLVYLLTWILVPSSGAFLINMLIPATTSWRKAVASGLPGFFTAIEFYSISWFYDKDFVNPNDMIEDTGFAAIWAFGIFPLIEALICVGIANFNRLGTLTRNRLTESKRNTIWLLGGNIISLLRAAINLESPRG